MYNSHETNHLFWSYSGDFSTDVAQAIFILFSSPVPYTPYYHCVQAGILKMDSKQTLTKYWSSLLWTSSLSQSWLPTLSKQACTHEWVWFNCIARIMKGCGCTPDDESSEFIMVKGIIIFKHSSEKIDNIMLNELTRQDTMLQVALLVGKYAG